MAKGKLSAQEMFDQQTGVRKMVDSNVAIELMRKFAKQETAWWQKMCDKWEKAYSGLLRDTE